MSDIMRPMSFEQLLNWTLTEHKKRGTVFGEHHSGSIILIMRIPDITERSLRGRWRRR